MESFLKGHKEDSVSSYKIWLKESTLLKIRFRNLVREGGAPTSTIALEKLITIRY